LQKGPNLADGVYLKSATWLEHRAIHPRIPVWQEEQNVELRDIDTIDIHLNVEASFLQTIDLGYATKRLKEQAENHIQRAFVKKQFEQSSVPDLESLELEGGKSTVNKVSAVYLLRFIRIREFKRKLLDILNYFRSVERRITMDHYGTTFKEHDPSFIRQFFGDPADLLNHKSYNFDPHFAMNRDDYYHLDKKKDLIVKDPFNVTVMYEIAVKDLEELEDRLLRTGTYFISKNIDTRNDEILIDRTLVLEDLYESETWFQDGKRKLIDCYMEAYEHCQDLSEQKRLSQVMVDIMHSTPNIDLNALYFTESYASEIISLELSFSLLKDIISSTMREEKVYVRTLSRWYHSTYIIRTYPGAPDELNTDDKGCLISLFPGSSSVGVMDFYSSLAHIAYFHEYLEQSVRDMVLSFHISNPVAISALKRTILQQSIVEWKLLAKEDKIQKDIKIKMTDDRASSEEIVILEQPEDYINLLADIIGEERKLPNTNTSKYSGNEQNNQTEGGYDVAQPDALLCQIYSNAIELLSLWKNMIDELYATDVLQRVYAEQAKLAGTKSTSGSLDPVNFETGDEVEIPKPIEVISMRAQTFSNLAVTEFDHTLADFTFATLEGVKKLLHSIGLEELRHVFQFQITQRILLQTAVKFNQIPIDELYVSSQYSSFFITAVTKKSPYDVNRSSTMDANTLRDIFLNVNTIKYGPRKRALDQYQRISSESIMKGTRPTMIRKRLRELKFKLAQEYCAEVISALQPYVLRHELTILSNELRGIIYQIGDDCGFTLGHEEHQANKHLIAKDGQIVNPMYIPHFMQILGIKFLHLMTEENEEPEDDPTVQHLSDLYNIFQRNYALILFVSAHVQLSMSSRLVITKGVYGQEQIAAYMRKFSSELNHLRQPESALAINAFISQKCELMFQKTLLTLKHLEKKMVLNKHSEQGQLAIQRAMHLLHHDQHTFLEMPSDNYWPRVDLMPMRKRNEFKVLLGKRSSRALPFQFLKRFLLMLSESERNYYTVEEMNVELLLEDLLQEENLYSTSMPEKSTQIQLEFLEQSVIIWQLKEHFLKLIEKDLDPETFNDPKKLEELFYATITRKAKRLYGKELKVREIMVQQRSTGDEETMNELQIKKKRETDFRKKQLAVILQEINKVLLNDMIHEVKSECSLMRAEMKGTPESTVAVREPGFDSKEKIFRNFISLLTTSGVRTKNKSGEVEITIFEKELELALDEVGKKLYEWSEEYINDIKRNSISIIESLKRHSFNLEMRLQYQQYIRELDKKSFKRRVQANLADKNYDLIFRVDSLTRQNAQLKEELEVISETIRREQQIKYEDTVTKLEKELILMKGRFVEYKRNFYQNMEKKFSEVKDTALIEIAKQKDGANAFKKKALQIVMDDNELSKMKVKTEKLKANKEQLQVLHKLKLIALESKYQKKIREADEERDAIKKRFFGNTEKIEAREQMLRKELVKTQEILNSTEMEVEQLKKDLQLQIKNKQKLVNWKVKNAQLLDELEEKVDKYERWNQFDVDKLVLELEKTKKEVAQYNKLRTRLDQKTEQLESKSKRTIDNLKKQLQKEQKLKSHAIGKLNSIKDEKEEGGSEEGEWQKKYFDVITELQFAQREIEVMKNHMELNGIDMPDHDEARSSIMTSEAQGGVTNRTMDFSARSFMARPGSASARSVKSVMSSRMTVTTPKTGAPLLGESSKFSKAKGYEALASVRSTTQSATPTMFGHDKTKKNGRTIASAGASRPLTIIPNYASSSATNSRPSSASISRGRRATTPTTSIMPNQHQRSATSSNLITRHIGGSSITARRAASASVNRRGSTPDLRVASSPSNSSLISTPSLI
jgi:hypothetical protein